jgi:NAD(P)-dependent dehydrogenase (short-subunit alcohol dehydrogenase family)
MVNLWEDNMKSTDLFDLTNKVALVTGASRGIGEAIAKLFAAQGAHVIVSSRHSQGCQMVADAINEAGGSSQAMACHIGSVESIRDCIACIRAEHGKLDILVNNAATNPYWGHILDMDVAAYEKTVEVNLRGYLFMSIEAGRLMRDCGGGNIINTASVNGLKPAPGQAIYSITKAAIINMTKAFAKECADIGIRCNAILPGLTKTQFASALFTQNAIYNAVLSQIPMGRHAEPQEMAGTALYLASAASSYTTGECIVVDGGYTL